MKMKPHWLTLSALVYFTISLSACTSVDSVQVFDEKQAANLLHENRIAHPTQQMIKIALPDKNHWKKIDMSYGTVGTPIMLIPANESRSHWTQSVRTKIRAFMNDSEATAIKMAQSEIATAKSQCTDADATILSNTKEAVMYRITSTTCRDIKNQYQIGKAFNGDDAIYLVYYTAISNDVPNTSMKSLAQAIENAKLVRNPRRGA